MKRLIHLSIPALLAILVGCATPEPVSVQEYKRVSLDEFFAGQIVSIPLSFEIPAQYVHATRLKEPVAYSYWMQSNEVAGVVRSDNLPVKTGYLYGKVSMNVGFDQRKGKFSDEDAFEGQLAKAGMTLVEQKRFEVNGYPVWSLIVRQKDGKVIYSMYIAMLIESNALYIVYRPPTNDLATGRAAWNRFISSIE